MKKINLLTLLSLIFTLYTGTVSAAQLSVDVIPGGAIDSTSTTSFSSFDINILVNDVTDFAGFEFDLGFDSAILGVTSIASGNIFGPDTFLLENSLSSNNASFSETSLALAGININTPTVLATLSFNTLSSGISHLSLSNVILSDSFGFELSPLNIASGDITVVPVPAAFWLFFTGIIGMFRMANKK